MALRRQKSTVYLDEADMSRIEAAAKQLGKSTASLIREALRLYADKLAPPMPRSIGVMRGAPDLSHRVRRILRDVVGRRG